MQDWQKENALYKASVCNPKRDRKLIWSSPVHIHKGSEYEVRVYAEWGDYPKNGSNAFHLKTGVYFVHSDRESERVCLEDLSIAAALIPKELIDLKKWNGCHSMGPWYYIENAVFLAGNKDHNGLLKGETKQIINGKSGLPAWHLVGIDPEGNEVPTYKLSLTHDGDKPTSEYKLEWRPWCRVGEGKDRQLHGARSIAIWLDATDEDLIADGLRERLMARHPALMQEFHDMIVGLGFTW